MSVYRINRSNPLARGLDVAFSGQATAGWQNVNGFTRAGTEFGPAVYLTRTASQYFKRAPFLAPGAYPWTFLSLFEVVGANNTDRGLMCAGSASSTTRHQMYVKSTGYGAMYTGYSGAFRELATLGTLTVGTPYAMASVFDVTLRQIWLNGVLQNEATASYTGVTVTPDTVTVGTNWYSGAAQSFKYDGPIALSVAWRRVLSAAEIRALSNDPWQLFERDVFRSFSFGSTQTGGSGALTGASAIDLSASAAMFGRAGLSGAGALDIAASGVLFGRAGVAGSSQLDTTVTGTLFGRAGLSGASALDTSASGTVFGRASAAGTAALDTAATGALFGRAGFSGNAQLDFAGSANLTLVATGSGALLGSSALAIEGLGSVFGRAGLAGASELSFSLTGDLAASAVTPLAGTSALDFAGSASLRLVASLVGASTLAIEGVGALSAKASLEGAAALAFALSSDITGAPAVEVASGPTGAGRSRRRRRYFVEIDDRVIFVESAEQAQQLLNEEAARVEQKVEQSAKRAIVRARVTGKAPKITRPRSTPEVKIPAALREAIGNPFEERINAAMRDAEIRAYLEWQAEVDDEEALFALVA